MKASPGYGGGGDYGPWIIIDALLVLCGIVVFMFLYAVAQ